MKDEYSLMETHILTTKANLLYNEEILFAKQIRYLIILKKKLMQFMFEIPYEVPCPQSVSIVEITAFLHAF